MLVTLFRVVAFRKLVAIVLTIGSIEKIAPRRLVVIGSVEGVVFRKLIANVLTIWGVEGVSWPLNDFCALASMILICSFLPPARSTIGCPHIKFGLVNKR